LSCCLDGILVLLLLAAGIGMPEGGFPALEILTEFAALAMVLLTAAAAAASAASAAAASGCGGRSSRGRRFLRSRMLVLRSRPSKPDILGAATNPLDQDDHDEYPQRQTECKDHAH
jgi:hypothetical protein